MILFDQKSFSLSPNLIYNKTAMKRIYLLLALFMGVCAFSACSDDNKEDEKNNELVGTWEAIRDWWEDTDGNIVNMNFTEAGTYIYIFEADGTGSAIENDIDGIVEKISFSYTYENNILTITYENIWAEEGTTATSTFNLTIIDNIGTLKATEVDDDAQMYGCFELKKVK